jgi:tetratricopeptide (TPR) repeat protein
MKPDLLKALALVWAEAGAHDLALASALMTPEPDRSTTIKALALATAGARDLRRARDLVPEMTRARDRSEVLRALAEAHLAAGRLEDAFEAAREMPPDEGIHDARSETLFSVLALALALGRLGEAADIAGSFGPTPAKARAFAELAGIHAAKGDLDRTRELLDDVLSLSLVVPANEDRDEALGGLGELLAAAGHTGPARALGDALADVPRAKVLGAIAVAELAASPDRAAEIVDSLGALQTYGVRWVEAETLLALASACVEQHDADRARAFALKAVDRVLGACALQDAGMRVLFDFISPRLTTA